MQAPKYDVQFLRSEALRCYAVAVVAAVAAVAVAVAGRGKLKNVRQRKYWWASNTFTIERVYLFNF